MCIQCIVLLGNQEIKDHCKTNAGRGSIRAACEMLALSLL